MAAWLIVVGIVGLGIVFAALIGCWRIKPPKPVQPPERFLWISVDGVTGPKTSFRNEDQS